MNKNDMNENEIKSIEEKKLAQWEEEWRNALLNYISDHSDEEERKKNAAVIKLMYSNLDINEQKQFKLCLRSAIDAYKHDLSIYRDEIWSTVWKLTELNLVQVCACIATEALDYITIPGLILLVGLKMDPLFTISVTCPVIAVVLFTTALLSLMIANPLPFCIAMGALIASVFAADKSIQYADDYAKTDQALSEKISNEETKQMKCESKAKDIKGIISKFHECEKIVESVDKQNRESYLDRVLNTAKNTAKRMVSNFFGFATSIVPPEKEVGKCIILNVRP